LPGAGTSTHATHGLEAISLPAAGDVFPALVEAAQGTRSELKYRPDQRVFELSHVLPPAARRSQPSSGDAQTDAP
jgi:hypothetical protein